jgi:hypothetical protein
MPFFLTETPGIETVPSVILAEPSNSASSKPGCFSTGTLRPAGWAASSRHVRSSPKNWTSANSFRHRCTVHARLAAPRLAVQRPLCRLRLSNGSGDHLRATEENRGDDCN